MINVSYGEIYRMTPDALRMAGMSLSQADESAEMVAWTETAFGGALSFIKQLKQQYTEKTYPIADKDIINCNGSTFLHYGIRIFDYIHSYIVKYNRRKIYILNSSGAIFIPYLICRLANAGFDCSVSKTVKTSYHWTVKCSIISQNPAQLDFQLLDGHGHKIKNRLEVRTLLNKHDISDNSYLTIKCNPNSFYKKKDREIPKKTYKTILTLMGEYGHHIKKGIEQGIMVTYEDFTTFKKLSSQMQVQSSEASHKHAGL